jgi:hypothetical protein
MSRNSSGNLGPIVPVALQYLYQGSTQVQGPPRQDLSSHSGLISQFEYNSRRNSQPHTCFEQNKYQDLLIILILTVMPRHQVLGFTNFMIYL